MGESTYHLRLSDEELRRYQGMAQAALARESAGWARCGVGPGARVADIGCGPGAVLVELARLVGPSGSVVGIDQDGSAVAAARQLIAQAGVGNAEAAEADATSTGLEAGTYDVVMIRHVLAHNGPRVADIISHATSLLRPGGHLWLVDVAVDGMFVDPADEAVGEMGRLYSELHARAGNDLNIGPRLGSLLASAGLQIADRQAYFNILSPFPAGGGPLWAARHALISAGLATLDDLERVRAAADRLGANPDSALFVATFTAAGRRAA